MGGGSVTYTSVSLQKIYKDSNITTFKKRLIYNKWKGFSNKDSIKRIIMDKSKLSSVKLLEKFNLITKHNGSIESIDHYAIESYISLITKETDVNIGFDIKRMYRYRFTNIDYNGNLTSEDTLYDERKKQVIIVNGDEYYYDNFYYDKKDDYKFLTTDIIDWKIKAFLESEYDKKNENLQISKKEYFGSYVEIELETYNIDSDDWYKPIIVNDQIEKRIDSDNNVIEIHMINVDDDSDDIWVEWIIDKSSLLLAQYTSFQNKHKHFFIDYFDKVSKSLTSFTFLTIPFKHNGHVTKEMIQPGTSSWAKSVGITSLDYKDGEKLPSWATNKDLKDLSICMFDKYNSNTEYINKIIKFVYGDSLSKKIVKVNTSTLNFIYYWDIEYIYQYHADAEASLIKTTLDRKMSINGNLYKDIEAVNLIHENSTTINIKQTNIKNTEVIGKQSEVDSGISTSDNEFYLIPLEMIQKMPIKDFFSFYFNALYNISYAEKTVHTKWYQSGWVTFLIIAVCLYTGNFEGAVMAASGQEIVKFVANVTGVDIKTIQIIIAVVTLVNGINGQISANSTAAASGGQISTAAQTSMTISNISSATAVYTQYEMNKMNDELEKIQNKNEEIQKDVNKIANKLNEILDNKINLGPRGKFDIQHMLMYSDITELNYSIMLSPLTDGFKEINEILS